MAPRGQRSAGFSRRAQLTLFTGYFLAGTGLLLGVILLAASLWNPAFTAGLRGAAQSVVAPLFRPVAAVRDGAGDIAAAIGGYVRAGSRNSALQAEVEIARIRLAEAEAVRAENRRLRALLGLREGPVRPVVVARLIGSTAASPRRYAYLGAGRAQGVIVGMPVVSARGVVGRVLDVGPQTSRVLLLLDSESVLPVRRAADEVVAFAEGRGDGLLRIRLVNLGINPLKVGDLFVTSGAGGFYQPGTAVAILTRATADGGYARVVSDPAATDFVAVMPIFVPQAVPIVAPAVTEDTGAAGNEPEGGV